MCIRDSITVPACPCHMSHGKVARAPTYLWKVGMPRATCLGNVASERTPCPQSRGLWRDRVVALHNSRDCGIEGEAVTQVKSARVPILLINSPHMPGQSHCSTTNACTSSLGFQIRIHKKTLASYGVQKSKEFGLGKAKALPKRVLVNVSEPLGR